MEEVTKECPYLLTEYKIGDHTPQGIMINNYQVLQNGWFLTRVTEQLGKIGDVKYEWGFRYTVVDSDLDGFVKIRIEPWSKPTEKPLKTIEIEAESLINVLEGETVRIVNIKGDWYIVG